MGACFRTFPINISADNGGIGPANSECTVVLCSLIVRKGSVTHLLSCPC